MRCCVVAGLSTRNSGHNYHTAFYPGGKEEGGMELANGTLTVISYCT